MSRGASPLSSTIRTVWSLREDVAEEGIIFVYISMVPPHMSKETVSIAQHMTTKEPRQASHDAYLCRLSALAYSRVLSEQNGHT